MSSYGPPGPGQPDEPYQQSPTAPAGGYPPPAPQWDQPPPGGPPQGQYAGPPQGPYGGPAAPYGPPVGVPKKGNGLKIALIIGVVAVLLLCSCAGVGIWWFAKNANDLVEAASDAAASADASEPSISDYSKGDCLVNDGTDDEPKLRKTSCGPSTYEVLSVIPLSTDPERCQHDVLFGAPESDTHYVYDGATNLSDFVLCLKQR